MTASWHTQRLPPSTIGPFPFSRPKGGTGPRRWHNVDEAPSAPKRTKAEIIAANKAAGTAAEAKVAKELLEEGNTILGSQVSVNTSKGRRVINHLIRTPDGRIIAVEVKSGDAVRDATQLAKDAALAKKGGVLIGKNAPIEMRGQQFVIETIVRRVP